MTGLDQIERPAALMDINAIRSILPHRYPFLLIDRILEIEVGKRVVGLKNITINEPYFEGHFPDQPIVPGVIIIEAMIQLGGVALLQMEQYRGKLFLFAGIDEMRFRRPVVPGDQLILTAELLKMRSNLVRSRGQATVNGQMVAEGIFLSTVVDWDHDKKY